LEDIQNIINKKNEELGEKVDREKAVKAVKDAENQIQLLNALTANFERVNKDWIVGYSENLLVEGLDKDYDAIQTDIDAVNSNKIDTANTNAKTVAAQEKVTALIEKWMKPDAEKETAKAKAIEASKLKEAEYKVYEAN